MIFNPLTIVRRFIGLGAMGAVGIVGAKSWLDEERTKIRLDYYQELSGFYEDAAEASCLTRDVVVDTAMARGWDLREVSSCGGASAYLRVVPVTKTPWMRGRDGFVMGFDAKGCQMALPADCTD